MDEILILNLVGTFAFGLSGGIVAVRKKMDLFGVLVLSVATGLGGGIMRDLILGHTPPMTLVDWRYLAGAGVAGLVVFLDFRQIVRWNRFVIAFDAAGLAIFTVTGTTIALTAGLSPVTAVLLGMLTDTGTPRGDPGRRSNIRSSNGQRSERLEDPNRPPGNTIGLCSL